MKSIRILVADDHKVVRMGVVAMLQETPEFQVIGEAESGTQAVELYFKLKPDLCLIDLRMPGLNGFEAIEQIRARDRAAKLLVLSTYDGDEDIHRALSLGASGYVLKDIDLPDLADAIWTVCSGKRYVPAPVLRRLEERGDTKSLSSREREVLELAAKGLINKEIASLLGVTERTAKFHLANVFQKLGVEDRVQAINEAVRRGIIHMEM